MARLFVLPQVDGDRPFELDDHMVLVGREPDSLLQIEDKNISKHHALLLRADDTYRVFDLHSSNGTYVNEERITAAKLNDGDVVQFGSAAFRFESGPPRRKVGLKSAPAVAAALGVKPHTAAPLPFAVAKPVPATTTPAPVAAAPLPAKPMEPAADKPLAAKPLAAKPLNPPIAPPPAPATPPPPSPIPTATAGTEEPKSKVLIPRKPMVTAESPTNRPSVPSKVLDSKETQDAAPLIAAAAPPPPAPAPAVPAPEVTPVTPPPQAQPAAEDPNKLRRPGLGLKPPGSSGEIRLKLKR